MTMIVLNTMNNQQQGIGLQYYQDGFVCFTAAFIRPLPEPLAAPSILGLPAVGLISCGPSLIFGFSGSFVGSTGVADCFFSSSSASFFFPGSSFFEVSNNS
eukprot:TRINITY_DN121074_c1_g1_i1.p3 TRINITY_DN121074_c1_g1~~TRINITY_DN121074_c1_g1_i1.p3  ORF type:complete len:116 (-),score=0.21 TRINITY_DN121074_c1_g1_i1:1272-1574(-)